MEDPNATVGPRCPLPRYSSGPQANAHNEASASVPSPQNGERLEKLRRASAAHTTYMSKAVEAQGCDRHILGTQQQV